jgi:hypothetical protein
MPLSDTGGSLFRWKKRASQRKNTAIGQKKLLFMAGVFRDSVSDSCPAVRYPDMPGRIPARAYP